MSGKDFFDLVKAIGESKSKQEEDRIIAEEVSYGIPPVGQVPSYEKPFPLFSVPRRLFF